MLVHKQINLKVGRLTKTALNLATSFFSIWESSYLVIYAWWSPTNFLVWMRNSSSLGFGSWRVLKAALWNRLGRESADNKISTLVFSSKFYQNPKAMLQNRIFLYVLPFGRCQFFGGQKAAPSQLKLNKQQGKQMRNYSPNLHVSLKQHL